MRAPRASASRALRSPRGAMSSTQQSEYSKPLAKSSFSGAPAGSRPRSSERCGWQDLAAAEMVVDEQAEPQASQAGRKPTVVRQHEPHRPGDVRHGLEQRLALDQRFPAQGGTRSIRGSASRRGNSFVDADEVADPRSFISARATDRPRPVASRAMPQPFTASTDDEKIEDLAGLRLPLSRRSIPRAYFRQRVAVRLR